VSCCILFIQSIHSLNSALASLSGLLFVVVFIKQGST